MTAPHVSVTVRRSPAGLRAIRRLLDEAFEGDFTDHDWQHALGGWHATVADGPAIVAHAAVVPRRLLVATRGLHAGYVEAVAVAPHLQGSGLGTAVMRRVNEIIRERFELGALSSGEWSFYQRLGWERWQGPTWVLRRDGGLTRTAEDDDGVMVMRTAHSGVVDLTASITCEEREGDSW